MKQGDDGNSEVYIYRTDGSIDYGVNGYGQRYITDIGMYSQNYMFNDFKLSSCKYG